MQKLFKSLFVFSLGLCIPTFVFGQVNPRGKKDNAGTPANGLLPTSGTIIVLDHEGHDLPHGEENPSGFFLAVNDDNDDMDFPLDVDTPASGAINKRFDRNDDNDKNKATNAKINRLHENDYVEIKLTSIPANLAENKRYFLLYDEERIRIWQKDSNGLLTQIEDDTNFDPTKETHLWVEGLQADTSNGAPQGIDLFLGTSKNNLDGQDDVKFHVFKVKIKSMKGLYDEQSSPVAADATQLLEPQDIEGRIYNNHTYDENDVTKTTWHKNKQYVDIGVEIEPGDLELPADAKLKWHFIDPDDRSDVNHQTDQVGNISAEILDSKDYDRVDPEGKGLPATGVAEDDGNDNLTPGTPAETAKWEKAPGTSFNFSGTNLTKVINRASAVRFNTTDHGGDNFVVGCDLQVDDKQIVGGGNQTGYLTVWTKIDVEYAYMAGVPYHLDNFEDDLNKSYKKAFVQFNFSKNSLDRRVVDYPLHADGNPNPNHNLDDAPDIAETQAGVYVQDNFRNINKGGWFYACGAWYFASTGIPPLYDSLAHVYPNFVRLNNTLPRPKNPRYVYFFDPANPTKFTTFQTGNYIFPDLQVGQDYWKVDQTTSVDWYANTRASGIIDRASADTDYEPQRIVIDSPNGNFVITGISAGYPAKIGRVMVFTKSASQPQALSLLVHEFGHGLGFAHKCGNYDYADGVPTCAMNYPDLFMLDGDMKKTPTQRGEAIEWTQGHVGKNLCAIHIKAIRASNLEDSSALNWPDTNPIETPPVP